MVKPITGHAFEFPPIRCLHDARARRIVDVLRPGPALTDRGTAFTAMDYCLAHHVLEGAEAAARAADKESFSWYRAHSDANAYAHTIPTEVGPRVIVSPDVDQMPRSGISETPYYVLGAATSAARAELRDLSAKAFAIGADAGFAELLSGHAVVVCLLRSRSLGDALHSWTITRLPGTVFCDYTSHPAVLARDLIHEAGHNWLNDALTATQCVISESAEFFSPWKQAMRPAYGFIHACWAFPLTMLFTAQALDGTSGELRRFLCTYLDAQRRMLASTGSDHEQAIGLIGDQDLRRRLHAVYHRARAL